MTRNVSVWGIINNDGDPYYIAPFYLFMRKNRANGVKWTNQGKNLIKNLSR